MEKEKFNRAVNIGRRIGELRIVKSDINNSDIQLTYIIKRKDVGLQKIGNDFNIKDILDRHDKMIRDEVDAEIERLKSEIEEL